MDLITRYACVLGPEIFLVFVSWKTWNFHSLSGTKILYSTHVLCSSTMLTLVHTLLSFVLTKFTLFCFLHVLFFSHRIWAIFQKQRQRNSCTNQQILVDLLIKGSILQYHHQPRLLVYLLLPVKEKRLLTGKNDYRLTPCRLYWSTGYQAFRYKQF